MSFNLVQRPLSWLGEIARYRWLVFFRIIAGFIGGYVITAFITSITATLLPMPRAEAVVLSSLLSYLWFLGLVIWAFAIKSVAKLWLIFGGIMVVLALIKFLIKSVGA